MTIIESIIYGIISGITEVFPISSRAHQSLIRYMFGIESRNFLLDFLVHIGILLAVAFYYRDTLMRFRRESIRLSATIHIKKRKPDSADYYNLRLLKTATITLVLSLVLLLVLSKTDNSLIAVMICLIINGIILLFATHSQRGNRDAKTMTGLDGIIMGILGAVSVFPGISRTGIVATYTTLRGADLKNVTDWSILLTIPAVLIFLIFDIIGIIAVGVGVVSFSVLFGYLLAALFAFFSGYFAISILYVLLTHSGFSYFAYYSLGTALFTFIIYLIT